jgi:hypothetical protein
MSPSLDWRAAHQEPGAKTAPHTIRTWEGWIQLPALQIVVRRISFTQSPFGSAAEIVTRYLSTFLTTTVTALPLGHDEHKCQEYKDRNTHYQAPQLVFVPESPFRVDLIL